MVMARETLDFSQSLIHAPTGEGKESPFNGNIKKGSPQFFT